MHLLPTERSGHRVIDAELISISDLAAATGIDDAPVSHALRCRLASTSATALL